VTPAVSVVIPTYNRAAILGATVESVLAQTQPAVEIVVVDDGSTDATPAVARRWGERVTYLRQANQGVEAARELGLARSHGRYVNFLDDDDVMLPTKLARQVALLERDPGLGVVHCRYHYVDAGGRHLETVGRQPEGDVLEPLVWGCFPWSGGPLVRRACLEASTRDRHRDWHGDWGMWLRTALAGWRWACVQEPLGWYRMAPGSMTDGKVANCERLVLHILGEVFARPSLPAAIRAERDAVHAAWYFWLACRYYVNGFAADGARCLGRTLALAPALRGDPAPLLELIRQDALTPRVRVHDPLRLVASVFEALPPEARFLSAHRARLEGRVLVGLALRSWGGGDDIVARRQLADAVAVDPSGLLRPEQFRADLVAWADRLSDERPADYVARVLADLPPEAGALASVRGRALADLALRATRNGTRRERVAGWATALRHRPTLVLRAPRRLAGGVARRVRDRIASPPQRLELLRHLVRRDFRLRYHGSLLGALWVLLQPLAQLAILVFLFERVVPLGIPAYPAFVFSGLLPWAWFSTSLAAAGGLFIGNRDLVRRPGFAPGVLVVVNVLSNLLVYAASLPLLVGLLLVFGRPPGPWLLALPLVLAVEGVLVVGLALTVATANVFYRDVQQIVAVALALLFYLTPVFYRPEQAKGAASLVFALNPMAGIVAAHRALWFGAPPPWPALGAAAAAAVLAAALGWALYRRLAADVVDRL